MLLGGGHQASGPVQKRHELLVYFIS